MQGDVVGGLGGFFGRNSKRFEQGMDRRDGCGRGGVIE